MKIKLILLCALVICIFKVNAQSDSLVQYYNSGEYHKAIIAANKWLNSNKANYESYYYRGLSQQALYQYNNAVESYRAAKSIKSSTSLNLTLAKAWELAGNNDKALLIYDEVINADSANIVAKARKASILKSQKDYLKAADLYSQLVKQDSSNGHFYYQLAYCTSKLGLSNLASEYYFSAYTLNVNDFRSIKGFLGELVKQKYYEDANAYIDSFLYAFPQHIYLLKQKAYLSAIGGNYLDAVQGFKEVTELGDSTMFTCKYYGQSLYNNGNYSEAVIWLDKYLSNQPDDVKNQFIIGLAYQKDYQYQNSLDHFDMVEDIIYDQENIALLFSERAQTYIAFGDYYGFRDSTGVKKKQNYDLALECYLKAEELHPGNNLIYRKLGLLYDDKLHNPQLALYYFQIYYNKLDPNKIDEHRLQWIQDRIGALKEEVHFIGQ